MADRWPGKLAARQLVPSPAIALVTAASAAALVVWATTPWARYLHHDYQPTSGADQLISMTAFPIAWALMVVAMMLPSTGALLRAVGALRSEPSGRRALQWRAALGFVAVWTLVGYAFRVGDLFIHAAVDAVGFLVLQPVRRRSRSARARRCVPVQLLEAPVPCCLPDAEIIRVSVLGRAATSGGLPYASELPTVRRGWAVAGR